MSVSAITSSLTVYQPATPTTAQQLEDALNNLATALDNGNVSSAKLAFASVQKMQSSPSSNAFATVTGTSGNPPAQATLASDLLALGKALQSGSLSKSQGAFSQLQSDLQANLKNSNSVGVSVYSNTLQGQRRQPAATGSGWDPLDSQLSSSETTDAEATSTFSILA